MLLQLHISQRKGWPCLLVAAEASHAEGPRSLYLTQRWLPLVLSIRRAWGVLAAFMRGG